MEISIENERYHSIDYAKTIVIYLVIVGHLGISSVEHNFIYSFHMPLFFFLSGMLFNINYPCKERISLNFKKLIIPYFWFSFISFLTLPFIASLLNVSTLSFNNFGQQLLAALSGVMYGVNPSLNPIWNNVLWFLPCLFWIQVFYSCIGKTNQMLLLSFLLLLLQILIPLFATYINPYMPYSRLIFGIDSAFIGLIFFHLGYLFKKNKLLEIAKKVNILVLLYSFLMSLAFLMTSVLGSVRYFV